MSSIVKEHGENYGIEDIDIPIEGQDLVTGHIEKGNY